MTVPTPPWSLRWHSVQAGALANLSSLWSTKGNATEANAGALLKRETAAVAASNSNLRRITELIGTRALETARYTTALDRSPSPMIGRCHQCASRYAEEETNCTST